MVRKLALLAVVAVLAVSLGCIMPGTSAIYAPVMDIKSPLLVGDTSVSPAKVGEATATGIILVSTGDASIAAAMKDGDIKRIHHVDTEELNILWLYVKKTTRVYGE
jgi:hypothetical protein